MPRNAAFLHPLVLLVLVLSVLFPSCAGSPTPCNPTGIERAIAPDFALHSAGETELLIVYRGTSDDPRDIIESALRRTVQVECADFAYGILIPQSSEKYLLVTVQNDSVRAFRRKLIDYPTLIRDMNMAIVDVTAIPE